MKNKLFLIGLIFFASNYGIRSTNEGIPPTYFDSMEQEKQKNEWIGIEKYWYLETTGYDRRDKIRNSNVYQFCMANKNDQNCAVINAYLLLQAVEKQPVQQAIKDTESRINAISEKIEVNEIAIDQEIDFVNKMRLEKNLQEL